MKFFLILILLIAVVHLRAQTTNIALIEQKAFSKKFFAAKKSLASDNFTVEYYRCEWKVDPAVRYIDGAVTSRFHITQATNSIAFDFTNLLTADSVVFHQQKIEFTQSPDETLTLTFPVTFNADEVDSVSVFYHGEPPLNENAAFIQASHNTAPIIWTLSEPFGAKDWWPCRNGLDDKADSIDIYITHPAQYKASSNGLLQEEATVNNLTTAHYKHRYPIASYLVAFAVTNYTVLNKPVEIGNATLPILSYVYPENSNAFDASTEQVKRALQLFSNYFGVYPFMNERYGQTQFGYAGGMEHQTNSFVYDAGENLNVHELAHQWFGDKITCASWEDIWLNEGFATYCADFLYNEKFYPQRLKDFVANDLADIISAPNGSVFVTDTTNIGRIFSGRLSYHKGAFLLRMLRFTLGDSIFFKGLQQYQQDPALKYRFAHTADLQRNLETASTTNLDYFFQQWFYGEGYPFFHVKWSENQNNKIQVFITETTSSSSVPFYKVMLPLTFKNATQEKTVVVDLKNNNQQETFDVGFRADTVLIDEEKYLISNNNSTEHIPSSTKMNDITVYPNPATDIVSIAVQNPSFKNLQAVLFNAAGQTMVSYSYSLSGNDDVFYIPLVNKLSHGIYFLRLETETGIHLTKKIRIGRR